MIAVKFYGEANSEGMPPEWPAITKDVGSDPLPSGFDALMTVESYEAHRASLNDQYQVCLTILRFKAVAPDQIKAEAQRRIFALTGYNANDPLPGLFRQLNMTTNALRVVARKVFEGINPTVEEAAMITSGIALVDKVNAVRAYSNTLEARAAGGEVFDVLAQPWPY